MPEPLQATPITITSDPTRGAEIVIDGRRYMALWPLVLTGADGGVEIRRDPPEVRMSNRCEHCGRADMTERVATSVEQAVEWTWLKELP